MVMMEGTVGVAWRYSQSHEEEERKYEVQQRSL